VNGIGKHVESSLPPTRDSRLLSQGYAFIGKMRGWSQSLVSVTISSAGRTLSLLALVVLDHLASERILANLQHGHNIHFPYHLRISFLVKV